MHLQVTLAWLKLKDKLLDRLQTVMFSPKIDFGQRSFLHRCNSLPSKLDLDNPSGTKSNTKSRLP